MTGHFGLGLCLCSLALDRLRFIRVLSFGRPASTASIALALHLSVTWDLENAGLPEQRARIAEREIGNSLATKIK